MRGGAEYYVDKYGASVDRGRAERDRHGGWMIDYDRFHETVALD